MPARELLRWYYFIPRTGAESQAWYEEYNRADCVEIALRLDRALFFLRNQDAVTGWQILEECRREILAKKAHASPLITRVLERWYLSTLAYYYYAVRDYDRATENLDLARDAIAESIENAPFLTVLASSCCEFHLHYARIARSQRRWSAMRDYLEISRDMIVSRAPLCQLASGREIFLKDVDDFFRSISPANDEEREALAVLTNDNGRRRGFEQTVRSIMLLPNVVIPFP